MNDKHVDNLLLELSLQELPVAPDLRRKVRAEIAREDLLELDSNFGFEDDLFEAGLDSMAIMQLLLLIEENFGIVIPAADHSRENFSTVKSIAHLIRARQRA